jgi:hypothetical protein
MLDATPKAPPKHTNAFPTSNRLVVMTPTGPRKLCTNGIVKFPILYPGRFSTPNAFSSLLFPIFIRYPRIMYNTPAPNAIRANPNMVGSNSFPEKLEIKAAGKVIFNVIFDNTAKSPSLKKLTFLSTYPAIIIAIKHPARVKTSNIYYLHSYLKIIPIILIKKTSAK